MSTGWEPGQRACLVCGENNTELLKLLRKGNNRGFLLAAELAAVDRFKAAIAEHRAVGHI